MAFHQCPKELKSQSNTWATSSKQKQLLQENFTLLNTVSWRPAHQQPGTVAVSARSFVVRRLFYDLTSRRGCRATRFNNSKSRKAAKINSISGRRSSLQRALHFYERAICSAGIKSVLSETQLQNSDRNLWLLLNSLSLSGPCWVWDPLSPVLARRGLGRAAVRGEKNGIWRRGEGRLLQYAGPSRGQIPFLPLTPSPYPSPLFWRGKG